MADAMEWRCFFCDEVFATRDAAALHFGAFDGCEPDVTACKLMAHQRHVLEYIRGLEEEIRLYQAENHPTVKAVFAVEDEMRRAMKRAEETGYNRGVADMQKQGFCPEPSKHSPSQTVSRADLTGWVRTAMRFIDLCDADAAGYDDLHEDAEWLTIKGFALFGIEGDAVEDACLADLKHRALKEECLK